MGAKTLKPATASLYDEDFAVWTAETARLLRAGLFDEVDIEHVAEEIEDMGKRDKRELHSRLTVLILHLLKWKRQPESTLLAQRAELDRLLEDSPSLRRTIAAAIAKVYPDVRQLAESETGLPGAAFPSECPFTTDQILDRAFLPE
jgi:hypothetical protein